MRIPGVWNQYTLFDLLRFNHSVCDFLLVNTYAKQVDIVGRKIVA